MAQLLIVFGSKNGGTEGLAGMVGEELRSLGHQVDLIAAADAQLAHHDAVIVVGSLYMGRWHGDTTKFVKANREALAGIPTWLADSGPLDDTADAGTLPSSKQVRQLAAMIGARGTQTFGGCLRPDAKGPMARSMSKTHSGDFRNGEHVRRWAGEVATALGG